MSEYEAGTFAMVETVRASGFMAVRTRSGVKPVWRNCLTTTVYEDSEVASVRPLVVLDPEDREQVGRLALACTYGLDTDAMQTALRSLTKPPKPPEPTGLGAVVEDAEGVRWVRYIETIATDTWTDGLSPTTYDDIDAVRVLSEGWSE